MKTINSLYVMMALSTTLFAQAPPGFNYQAVARDAAGAPLVNQTICIHSTITNGEGGSSLYDEYFMNVLTNAFGLFTLNIGNGDAHLGNFANIPWGSVTAWQEIELDAGCTGTYVMMGRSQLLSVPYAMSAASAPSKKIGGSGITLSGDTINSVWTQGGNHIYSNNSGNVGIGMYPAFEKLEVAGGIRVGDAPSPVAGTIQYNSSTSDFEGYANSHWKSFTKTKYQTFFGYGLISAVRNALVFSTDSMIVSETGLYFLSMNIYGLNSPSINSSDYDYECFASVYKKGFGGISNSIPFFAPYLADASTHYYLTQFNSTTAIVYLIAGDVLKLAALVNATGSPTGTWHVSSYDVQLLKLD